MLNSNLLKFFRYLEPFLSYKQKKVTIFNGVRTNLFNLFLCSPDQNVGSELSVDEITIHWILYLILIRINNNTFTVTLWFWEKEACPQFKRKWAINSFSSKKLHLISLKALVNLHKSLPKLNINFLSQMYHVGLVLFTLDGRFVATESLIVDQTPIFLCA